MQESLWFIFFLFSIKYVSGERILDSPLDAIFKINTTSGYNIIVSRRNIECIKCPFTSPVLVRNDSNQVIHIDTGYPTYDFEIKHSVTKVVICFTGTQTFGESGEYFLNITENINSTDFMCNFSVLVKPAQKYKPMVVAFVVHLFLILIFVTARYVYTKIFVPWFARSNEDQSSFSNSNEMAINDTAPREKVYRLKRLESIDSLRGLCLCIMIFVNYGAGGYDILHHSIWNGLHLADLVFPCFVFIMGVSIALAYFAISKKNQTFDGRSKLKFMQLASKCINRTCLLFFFGLLVSNGGIGGVALANLRIMGVLQRFAISYFVCAMLEIIQLHYNGYIYQIEESFEQVSWKSRFKEIFLYKFQWLVMMIITLVWLLITFAMPVPGCPTGYIGPGGLHENASHVNCTGGAAGYLDRKILGITHLDQNPTCKEMYETKVPHDPEGLLGSLTSCLMTYLGVIAGHIFIHYKEPPKRVLRFISYGIVYGTITLILTKASRDDGWIPINKNLWSLSFILGMAGASLLVLTFFYLLIDVKGWYTGVPFIYPGKNSICIYICSEIFANYFPVRIQTPSTHSDRLSMDLYSTTLWVIVAAVLYYKKIFINL
jgi:heparan-alpha-glucosaminide N-acetyltransferase